jgi:hypothetical protein
MLLGRKKQLPRPSLERRIRLRIQNSRGSLRLSFSDVCLLFLQRLEYSSVQRADAEKHNSSVRLIFLSFHFLIKFVILLLNGLTFPPERFINDTYVDDGDPM